MYTIVNTLLSYKNCSRLYQTILEVTIQTNLQGWKLAFPIKRGLSQNEQLLSPLCLSGMQGQVVLKYKGYIMCMCNIEKRILVVLFVKIGSLGYGVKFRRFKVKQTYFVTQLRKQRQSLRNLIENWSCSIGWKETKYNQLQKRHLTQDESLFVTLSKKN